MITKKKKINKINPKLCDTISLAAEQSRPTEAAWGLLAYKHQKYS